MTDEEWQSEIDRRDQIIDSYRGLLEDNANLSAENIIMRDALDQISMIDYRGHRPRAIHIAQRAIKAMQEQAK